MVTPADIYKQYNEIKKKVDDLKNRVDLAALNRDSIWYQITDLQNKSSRIEKLILLLSVIQLITIIILGV